jgi:hypothetical protein
LPSVSTIRVKGQGKDKRPEKLDKSLDALFVRPTGTVSSDENSIVLSDNKVQYYSSKFSRFAGLDWENSVADRQQYYDLREYLTTLRDTSKVAEGRTIENCPKNAKNVLSWYTSNFRRERGSEYSPTSTAVSKLIQEWSNEFRSMQLDYEIRWDWEAFNALGHLQADRDCNSCYRANENSPPPEWMDSPVCLYEGLTYEVPTFIVLLYNKTGSFEVNVSRCWGFLWKPSGGEYAWNYIALSNNYSLPGTHQTHLSTYADVMALAIDPKPDFSEKKYTWLGKGGDHKALPLFVNNETLLLGLDSDPIKNVKYPPSLAPRKKCVRCGAATLASNRYQHPYCRSCRTPHIMHAALCTRCGNGLPTDNVRWLVVEGLRHPYCVPCFAVVSASCVICRDQYLKTSGWRGGSGQVYCGEECYYLACFRCHECSQSSDSQPYRKLTLLNGAVLRYCSARCLINWLGRNLERENLKVRLLGADCSDDRVLIYVQSPLDNSSIQTINLKLATINKYKDKEDKKFKHYNADLMSHWVIEVKEKEGGGSVINIRSLQDGLHGVVLDLHPNNGVIIEGASARLG